MVSHKKTAFTHYPSVFTSYIWLSQLLGFFQFLNNAVVDSPAIHLGRGSLATLAAPNRYQTMGACWTV
jgi:hypothetical protein